MRPSFVPEQRPSEAHLLLELVEISFGGHSCLKYAK